MRLQRGVKGFLLGLAMAWLSVASAIASPFHGQVTFNGLPLPGSVVTVTATRGDKKVFAPLVSIYEYDNFEDAVKLIEESPYGLQAGIYTSDLRKAFYAVDHINVGGIMINDTSIFRVDHMPYGGNKMSGLGREGVRFAVEEMTNLKMVVIKP